MTRFALAALLLVSTVLSGCAAGYGSSSEPDIRNPTSSSGPMVGNPHDRESPR